MTGEPRFTDNGGVLEERLIRNKEATYLLVMDGEAMRPAGILPGDLLLVERTTTFHDGDIVVAELEEGWVLRHLRRRAARLWLENADGSLFGSASANPKPVAVVRAMIRKYL